jgi:hypothetical protein
MVIPFSVIFKSVLELKTFSQCAHVATLSRMPKFVVIYLIEVTLTMSRVTSVGSGGARLCVTSPKMSSFCIFIFARKNLALFGWFQAKAWNVFLGSSITSHNHTWLNLLN